MKDKFSPDIQVELNDILAKIEKWKNYFEFNIEFYFDGWAIFLREKNVFPRCITIFKSFSTNTYSIKSFEVHLKNYFKEEYKELYFVNNIKNRNLMLEELKDIIYGKDLATNISKIYHNSLLKQ
ncbi:MAG: hypothetical protein ACFE9Q_11785 [Candidatus Hodarchaeota archaeon]